MLEDELKNNIKNNITHVKLKKNIAHGKNKAYIKKTVFRKSGSKSKKEVTDKLSRSKKKKAPELPEKKIVRIRSKKSVDLNYSNYSKDGGEQVNSFLERYGNRKAKRAENPYVFKSSERFDKNLVIKSAETEEKPERPFPLSMIPSSRYSVGENIRRFVFCISAIVMVVAAVLIGTYFWSNYQSEKQNNELQQLYTSEDDDVHDDSMFDDSTGKNGTGSRLKDDGSKEDNYSILTGAKKLLAINDDVVGYINIPGTQINYPVMRSKKDNNEYLKKDIYGKWKYAGSVFMDFRNKFDEVENGKLTVPNSNNIVIYGHNMRNGTMFGNLRNYINEDDYYEKHPIIYLNSNYRKYTYKIFGFFVAVPKDKTSTFFDYWNKLNFKDKDDFYDYVDEVKRRTIRNTKVDVQYGDDILILSTCNNNLVSNGRFVIAARKVRDGEDPLEGTTGSTKNKNVKMPSSYYSGKSTYDEKKFEGYERK